MTQRKPKPDTTNSAPTNSDAAPAPVARKPRSRRRARDLEAALDLCQSVEQGRVGRVRRLLALHPLLIHIRVES